MEQDTGLDPDPSRPESQGSHHENSESHLMKIDGFNLDLGLRVCTGEGSGVVHSLEKVSNMTKAVVSKEKKLPTCVRSSNLETQISTRPKTMFSSAELSIRVLWIADVL